MLNRSIGRAKAALEEEKVDHAETKERNRLLVEELQAIKLTTAYRDQEKMARAKTKMQARINELAQVALVNLGSLLEPFCLFERLDAFP